MKYLVLFSVYGLVFGSPLTFLPSYLNLTNIVIFLSLLLAVLYNVKFKIKPIMFYLTPLLIYLFYDLISFSFDDISFTIQNYRLIGINISAFIISYILVTKYKYNVESLLKYLSFLIVVSCIISIFSVQYHDIQKFINLIIKPNMNEGVLDYVNNFRFNGITGLSGSELSLVYSIFFIYAAFKLGNGLLRDIFILTISLIVLAGIIIVGRTGLVSSFIFFFVTAIYLKKYRYILFCLCLALLLIPISYFIYEYSYLIPSGVRYILLWAFEPVYKGLFLSELSGSNSVLAKMWFFPSSSWVFLFGLGSWGELINPPSGFYKPDPGYMRMMYQHGVLIEFLGLTIFLSSIFYLKAGTERFIYTLLFFIALLFNFKEVYIYRDPLFSLLSLTFYISIIRDNFNYEK